MFLRCGGYQGDDRFTPERCASRGGDWRRGPGIEIDDLPRHGAGTQGERPADARGKRRSRSVLLQFQLSRRPRAVAARARSAVSRHRSPARLSGAGRRSRQATGGRCEPPDGLSRPGVLGQRLRHFSNRLHPIRHPRDCLGMKIRTLDNALHQQVFRALGFEPVTIDVKDMPAAIASGAVDAQENPLTNTLNFGLHRTHRHISMTSHFFGVALGARQSRELRRLVRGYPPARWQRGSRRHARATRVRDRRGCRLPCSPPGGRMWNRHRRHHRSSRLRSCRRRDPRCRDRPPRPGPLRACPVQSASRAQRRNTASPIAPADAAGSR